MNPRVCSTPLPCYSKQKSLVLIKIPPYHSKTCIYLQSGRTRSDRPLKPNCPLANTDVDKNFPGKCCRKEDCGAFSREECSGGVPHTSRKLQDLFSERVRSILAMRNLWDEREPFLKFQRGWDVDEEIVKARKEVGGRDQLWNERSGWGR